MCEVIKIGEDSTAIICGGKKDHVCNENGTVYGTKDGKRHFFKKGSEAEKWYAENYQEANMGSVACSICGGAAIDSAYKL